MIILDATTKTLEVVLALPVQANQSPFVASYEDIQTSTYTPGESDGVTNGSTPATVLAAPGGSTYRLLKSLSLFNKDTAAITATIQVNNNGTKRTIIQNTLQVGSTMIYDDKFGWFVIDANGNHLTGNAVQAVPIYPNRVCEGRLTLTSGTPVTTADVTGGSIIYWTPYTGNRVALYANGAWSPVSFSETSIAMGTRTLNVGVDIFAYNNNGTLALEQLEWTNGTTRATALSLQDGVLVKSTDPTRRYLGSYYSQTTTTTEDSQSRRLLFNYYNRVPRTLFCAESVASYNYTTATWRAANSNTTDGAGRFTVFVGYSEIALRAVNFTVIKNTGANVGAYVGIGINSTSTPAANMVGGYTNTQVAGDQIPAICSLAQFLSLGYNYVSRLENASTASGTTTWLGGGALGATGVGMNGEVML